MNGNNGSTSYIAVCVDSFGVKHIPNKIKEWMGNKNIMTNIFKIQAYDSIMWNTFALDLLILY